MSRARDKAATQAPSGPLALDGKGLRAHVGRHLGHSRWHQITQEQIDSFADATGDHQWIHVDAERAKAGPFGRTVAHGYLTLSLAPLLLQDVLTVEAVVVVNYGLNRVRFPSPVPAEARVRLGAELLAVEEVAGGAQATLGLTFEMQEQSKPACVAEIIFRFYDEAP